jgi:hypothetical protein
LTNQANIIYFLPAVSLSFEIGNLKLETDADSDLSRRLVAP